MRKVLVITDEIGQALNQLWNWARCEASTAQALPIWQKIVSAVVDEPVEKPAE